VNLVVASNKFDESGANRENKYYSMKYKESGIPQAWQAHWGRMEAGVQVHTPPPLRFVPSNLVVANTTAGDTPKALMLGKGVDLWWLGKGAFALPKAQVRAKLTVSSELFNTPVFAAMRMMHVELSKQGLEEPMEDFGDCGLNWDLKDTSDGYHISMDGYAQHMGSLVQTLAGGIRVPPVDEEHFRRTKQKLIDELEDATSKMPYEHAMEALSVMATNSVFSTAEKKNALKNLEMSEFSGYLSQLAQNGVRVQMLVTGNTDEQGARALAASLTKGLDYGIILPRFSAKSLALQFDQDVQVRMRNPISGDSNNAVVNAYQFGSPPIEDRVKIMMLGKMISQPAYDELRTKQQLGYVVFATVMPQLTTLQLVMIVQGAKKAPDDIDGRIEAVLDKFDKTLRNFSMAEFKSWKSALRSTLATKDENMAQEADRFWAQITSDQLCFEKQKLALSFLDSFEDPSQVAAAFQGLRAHPRKVSVRLFGATTPMNATKPLSAVAQNTSSLVGVDSGLVVYNDGKAEKATVAKGQKYWPTTSVCKLQPKAKPE